MILIVVMIFLSASICRIYSSQEAAYKRAIACPHATRHSSVTKLQTYGSPITTLVRKVTDHGKEICEITLNYDKTLGTYSGHTYFHIDNRIEEMDPQEARVRYDNYAVRFVPLITRSRTI